MRRLHGGRRRCTGTVARHENSGSDTCRSEQGQSSEQNRIIGGHALFAGIQIRGLLASIGMDYFNSITPMDPYRAGRIDDARGPNSILFGIGQPGGSSSGESLSNGSRPVSIR